MKCVPALALCLPLLGCQVDLGQTPFFCNNGNPECPEGYSCVEVRSSCSPPKWPSPCKVCVKQGSPPPVLADGGKLDRRPTGEGPASDGPRPPQDGPQPPKDGPKPGDVPPVAGQIAITEFLADPFVVSDSYGEWIELFNAGGQPVDINGWTLKDSGTDTHVIAAGKPLVVPAKGYLLLGRSANMVDNGGVSVAYAYSGFYLANTADEIILLDGGGKVVDQVVYTTSWTLPVGASLSVKSPLADKNNFANWCPETKAWPGSKGDKGTPGGNPGC
jgi:hypothetical protein